MRFKSFFLTAAAALVLAASSVAAFAQVTQASGKVTLKQADGSEAPVVGAVVDIYRTDIKWSTQVKTDKSGKWQHAGIPFSGTYTVAVSAPGARPAFATNIRFSQTPVHDFTLDPGDGSRLTLDQMKAAATNKGAAGAAGAAPASGGGGGGDSKEEKARREALERERKEIEEKNKSITEGNEIVARTFKAGNEAYQAKRYDEAITLFNEGLTARPEETGLLVSKSFALIGRGVARFNEGLKNTADASIRESAFKDWRDAAEIAGKAVEISKTRTADDAASQATLTQNRVAAATARAEALRFVATKVDKAQLEAAYAAHQELIALEMDPGKKNKLALDTAKMFFDAGDFNRAADEYRKLVAADPDNADANLYLGFALFNTADKTKFQEAANYIGRFVEKAPDTNPTKAEAKSILDFLKTQENIKPERVQPTRTTGRRRP